MRSILLTVAALAAAFAVSAQTPQGLIAVKSGYSVKETMDRFEAAAKAKGMSVFARVDHSAGAQKIGKTLRPTEVLIWGSPQGGTPLMECAQSVAIDLPQKALAWQDDKGDVYLGYNDPAYLMNRHAAKGCEGPVGNLSKALAALAQEATVK